MNYSDIIQDALTVKKSDALDMRSLSWAKIAGSAASDGVYLKTELDIDDKHYYLKLSNYDSYRGVFGHESVNELIACRLGKLLEFNVPEGFIRKALVRIDSIEYETFVYAAQSYKTSESRCSFEAYYRNFRLTADESPLDMCKRCGWDTDVYKMFVFDYLILNRDRHGANLEVLKNSDTKLSPLFDNGVSFVCTLTNPEDVAKFNEMEDRAVNNFIGDRSLERNLRHIDKKLQFNELLSDYRAILFDGLDDVLPSVYFDKIWEIIAGRWENVAKFRID